MSPCAFTCGGSLTVLIILGFWRSGTVRAANGEAVVSIVVVGRVDVVGAPEVEVVGAAAIRVWSR